MGDPKRKRKQYETPRKTWDRSLLEREKKLLETYGLRNKKELRRQETWLRNKRKLARDLLALPLSVRMQREKELLGGLTKIGLVKANATIDDVLGLKVEELLEKRLQTLVYRKGLANSMDQARQFVVHGHIAIGGRKASSPNYVVPINEANSIGWYKRQIKTQESHRKDKTERDIKREFEEAMGKGDAQEPEADVVKEGAVRGKEALVATIDDEADSAAGKAGDIPAKENGNAKAGEQ